MTSEYIEQRPRPLAIRDTQSKATGSYVTPLRMAAVKKTQGTMGWGGFGEKGTLAH